MGAVKRSTQGAKNVICQRKGSGRKCFEKRGKEKTSNRGGVDKKVGGG